MIKKTALALMDEFDIQILKILQVDNMLSQREIGVSVNLSAAAVHRRIWRMQESGIISANIAVADPVKLGSLITLLVEVTLESEQLSLIDKAKESFIQSPFVQQCFYVTGEIDFMLVIIVPSMADYETLTRSLFFGNQNVKRFTTFVSMDRVKTGLSLPL